MRRATWTKNSRLNCPGSGRPGRRSFFQQIIVAEQRIISGLTVLQRLAPRGRRSVARPPRDCRRALISSCAREVDRAIARRGTAAPPYTGYLSNACPARRSGCRRMRPVGCRGDLRNPRVGRLSAGCGRSSGMHSIAVRIAMPTVRSRSDGKPERIRREASRRAPGGNSSSGDLRAGKPVGIGKKHFVKENFVSLCETSATSGCFVCANNMSYVL